MKYKIILSCMLVTCSFSFFAKAQELHTKTYKNRYWTESFQVLKSDKKVKEGSYEISYGSQKVVIGKFTQGVPVGRWIRLDAGGNIILRYNFGSKKSEFYEPEPGMDFEFAVKGIDGDKLTFPASLLPPQYLFSKSYSELISGMKYMNGEYMLKFVIEIDATNTPQNFTGYLYKNGIELVKRNLSISDDMKWAFVSGSINGKPVPSRLILNNKLQGSVWDSTPVHQSNIP